MIVNEDARKTLLARSRIVSTIRRYLEERSFLEVGEAGRQAGRQGGKEL
jgi:lysyl-tRNA synthetase class II